jgi:hypothetical protein
VQRHQRLKARHAAADDQDIGGAFSHAPSLRRLTSGRIHDAIG